MQAAHTDLSHVRDCPDSTPEPVVQHEVQSQRRSYRSSLAAQTDASPGHIEDPLPDVRSDASFEHSNQDDGPCFSPDNIGDRPSLPVSCSSYKVSDTEQNQALYVDNPLLEAEESPSKQIYGTEAENTESAVQYQQRGACHKEALSTCYQCGRDVDHASTDRQDVEDCGADSEAENDEVQTETVAQQSEDVESSSQNRTEREVTSDDDCIRPYAVAYNQYGHRGTSDEDACDIQPYAVTYDEGEGHYENHSADSFQSVCGQDNTSSDIDSAKERRPDPMYSGNALLPNPMYSGNALLPNPVYVPNAAQPMAGRGQTNINVLVLGVAVAVLIIAIAFFLGAGTGKQDSFTQTALPDPTFTAQTDGSQHVNYTSPHVDYTSPHVNYTSPPHVDYTSPQVNYTSPIVDYTSPQPTSTIEGKETEEVKQTTIVFGGKGQEPGMFDELGGVVVSPSNEIFVADAKGVQVFSMKGVYLRRFPITTPEYKCETIAPEDVSIDGKGHLWVIGVCFQTLVKRIVRYTETGHHITTLHPPGHIFHSMAVDSFRSRVVVVERFITSSFLSVLQFNGTVVHTFRMGPGVAYGGLVTVGRTETFFVSDRRVNHIYAFNENGHCLFRFGGDLLRKITGMCTDSSGNVLVADGPGGKVELFTEDGRYVRRVASGLHRADSVAVAPGGQLVVTNHDNGTVTIFPH
uniref:Uncharacterized protein n=1 Tax=Branchiostoma floridae TaxID=7739 RepID=C3YZ69_BRAFL|eukprot:XP_002598565.1 hypothetical protein BRAFLDRAFT_66956 [Branchiostoma floridae]